MSSIHTIARSFGLKPVRGGYHGACPVCGYPSGFSLKEKEGKLLFYCHAGQCRWEEIRYVLQSKGFLKEKQGFATVAIVAPSDLLLKKMADSSNAGCNRKTLNTWHLELLANSLPTKNTPAEWYLKSRGITISLPGTIRYLPRAFHTPGGHYFPAMLARVEHIRHSQPIGVHRTFLKPDGSGKAALDPNKMMLGSVQGGSVHLAEPTDTLAVCEGIETGLSIQQASGIPTWAALSCGGIQNLVLPSRIKTVIICADHDQPGLKAAESAAQQWIRQGLTVKLCKPPQPGFDFNDLLMEASAHG